MEDLSHLIATPEPSAGGWGKLLALGSRAEIFYLSYASGLAGLIELDTASLVPSEQSTALPISVGTIVGADEMPDELTSSQGNDAEGASDEGLLPCETGSVDLRGARELGTERPVRVSCVMGAAPEQSSVETASTKAGAMRETMWPEDAAVSWSCRRG
jgi:hypothetical protein